MKEKTGVTIYLTNALADIHLLTRQEQAKIREIEREELINNLVSAFVNSSSFTSAWENCEALLRNKSKLQREDYGKIILASISNHEIYQSFFTSTLLNKLCEWTDGYVITWLENLKKDIWDKFVKLNQIKLKRQVDQVSENSVSDVPF